jgi:hypothetical protein
LVALALSGSPLTTLSDQSHWVSETSYLGQEVTMTPSISNGQRKLFTELDFAGLDDLGWVVTPVPEPATIGMTVVGWLRFSQGCGGSVVITKNTRQR